MPIGVVIGPLMATLLRLIESRVSGGSGVPAASMTSTPACWTSQSNDEPLVAAAASSTRRVASVSSGPVPSPGMSVTRWVVMGRRLLAGFGLDHGRSDEPRHAGPPGRPNAALRRGAQPSMMIATASPT